MTYSVDFRRKSVREKEGLSMKEVGERFGIGVASVMRWVKELVPRTTRNKPALKINMEALARDVEEHTDHYHYERAARFSVSSTCIRRALKRLGVTYKKSLGPPPPRPVPRHVPPSRKHCKTIARTVGLSSSLMRVALLLICPGPMGIQGAENVVLDVMIGELGGGLTLLERYWEQFY